MTDLSDKAKNLWKYCQENHRVCPQPGFWHDLWQILPNRKQMASGGWNPALPLILAAWDHSLWLTKMLRLREHIQWDDERGHIDIVDAYLRGLSEEQWFHGKD